MIRGLLCAWWLLASALTASAQLQVTHDPEGPYLPRDRLIAFLDAFEIPDEARAEALAAHDRQAAAYAAAYQRQRLGYARANEAQRAWHEEHRPVGDPRDTHGIDFGVLETQLGFKRDRLAAEEALRLAVLALPAIAENEAARAAWLAHFVRPELEWLRHSRSTSPRFRDLYFLTDLVDESGLSEHARLAVAPLLHTYADQFFTATLAWRTHSITLTTQMQEARIYGIDLGTEVVEAKFERSRALFAEMHAHHDRMIAINRLFTAQVVDSLDDEVDRRAFEQRLTRARFPEYCADSPVHRVFDVLSNHPALTDAERRAVEETAETFEQRWEALRSRLIATATSGETADFLRRGDEVYLHNLAYAFRIAPRSQNDLEVIHPCEPLIIERERLVKSTLRALAALLSDNTKRRLDADIVLILAWATISERRSP